MIIDRDDGVTDDNPNNVSIIEGNVEGEEQTENIRIDTDRDEESDDNDIFIKKSGSRRKAILSDDEDSDNENDEASIVSKADSLEEQSSLSVKSRIISTNDSDSEDGCHPQESTVKSTGSNIQYRSDIFDTEETDDEVDDSRDFPSQSIHEDIPHEDSDLEEMEHKDTSPNINKITNKKQSSKQRNEEMLEIHSTTQKMVRESEVVLPYHRPRQRTLKEFLNRKKNVPQFDESTKKRRSLVMSMMDMKHLKEIEERKKDIDKFYKEEEDEDMEETDDTVAEPEMNSTGLQNCKSTVPTDEDSLPELPDLDQIDKAEEEQKNVNGKEDDEDWREESELSLKENVSIEIRNAIETLDANLDCSVNAEEKEESNDQFINCKTGEFSCQERKTDSKEDKIDIIGRAEEEDIEIIQEKAGLCHEDTEEDFRLHLDTEDFDNDILDTECLMKSSNGDLKEHLLGSCSKSTNDPKSGSGKTQRLSLLASKFPQLDLGNLTCVTPKLSLGEGAFVELDDPTPVQETGVEALLNRFIEHSKKTKTPIKPKNVLLGIVSKEVSAEGKEKLVHSNITVKLEAKEVDTGKCDTPGARLTLLKNTLKAKMLEQREKARQRREKEKEFLDSERVIQDYHEDGLPDEEAELTDKSETDYETESEPEENDVIIKDKKRKKNKYLDEEAEVDEENDDFDNNDEMENGVENDEDDESDTEMVDEDKSENEDEEGNEVNTHIQKRKPVCRRIIQDDEDDENDNCAIVYHKGNSETEDFKLCLEDTQEMKMQEECSSKEESGVYSISRANTEELFTSQVGEENAFSSKKELRNNSSMGYMDQSFEMMGSVIPAQQPGGGFCFKDKLQSDVSATYNPVNSLTLFSKLDNTTPEIFTRENSDKLECHSAFNFLLTPLKASQVTSSNTQSIKRSLLLDTPTKPNENIPATNPDLLGLCSGTFVAETCAKSSTENNMDDLMGLCSGKFETQKEQDTQAVEFSKPTHSISSCADTVVIDDENETSNEIDDISTCFTQEQKTSTRSSDEESLQKERVRPKKKKKRKRILNLDLSDEEEEGPAEDEDKENAWSSDEELMEYDENEEPVALKEKFKGFKDSIKGGIMADFLDKEAELSGSEEESDDEDEPDEDNDFMEQEAGDLERFDEEELRDQVGRAHLKSLIDSDKRELRLLQEMYLEDGDLHGEGRQRKFRWRNMDGQDDDQNRLSGEEEKEDEVEEESDWRKQRFEREKYLNEKDGEKEDKQSSPIDEEISSLQRASSLKLVKNLSNIRRLSSSLSNATHSQESPLMQSSLKKRGSFLSRDDTTLQRLASFTKDNVTVGGARQGGNFVFQTLTEEEVEKRSKEVETKREKGRIGKAPEKKRMRIERSFFSMEETVQSASVFKHL